MDAKQIQSYQEIVIEVTLEDVEAVANYIIENISNGLVFEDEDNASKTRIKFYVASEADVEFKLNGLKKYLIEINPDYAGLTIGQGEIKNLDWIDAYRKSVTAVFIGESIVVKPPWAEASYPGKTVIVLEPKMAFGTGRHETSRSCLAELEQLDLSGKSVLDLGCGSGILSIFAARKGAAAVDGFDIDPLAIENSRENFLLNGVEGVCRAKRGTIDSVPADDGFDIVVVNIIKSVILPILDRLKRLVKPDGVLILSGLLEQDADEIEEALKKHGLNGYSIRHDAEWVTYAIRVS